MGKSKRGNIRPMNSTEDDNLFVGLLQRINPQYKFLKAWKLEGGISAQMTALEIQQPDGSTKRFVIRIHGEGDRRQNPAIASNEFKLLGILRSTGVPAPIPWFLDQSGKISPDPVIVIEYIEGKTDFAPGDLPGLIHQMAATLVKIHRIDPITVDLSFLPQRAAENPGRSATLDHGLKENRIREILEPAWSILQQNKPGLNHGDFWPGNILWQDNRLVGVLDWGDASIGDPLADIANTRLEILWAYGVEAMALFTRHYQSQAAIDFTTLPYWDLYAALGPISKMGTWGLDPAVEQQMKDKHSWFTTQAFEKLST